MIRRDLIAFALESAIGAELALFAGFLLCFLVIIGRAFWLQGVQGGALASEAISQQTETVTVPGLRGSLLDRRGDELATVKVDGGCSELLVLLVSELAGAVGLR